MSDAPTTPTAPTPEEVENLLADARDARDSINDYCGKAAELDQAAMTARENGRDDEGEELPYAEEQVRLEPAQEELDQVIARLRAGNVDAAAFGKLQETVTEWRDTLEDCDSLPTNMN